MLHHLCLFRAPAEMIQMVLWQAPELASQPNKQGEIPLHWAVRLSAPHECLGSLLTADWLSGTTFRDWEGHTPLSLLWDRYNDRFMEVWWDNPTKLATIPAWKRVMLFFQPNHGGDSSNTDAFPSPLHAAAQTPCPPALFPLMIQVYRNQLDVCDARGRNPLMIACSNAVSNRSIDLRTKVQQLLKADPKAAHVQDKTGRTAFVIAVGGGIAWNEGLKELFELQPPDLCLPDAVTRLPPFLLAATGASHRMAHARHFQRRDMMVTCSEKSLATIFELLKANPSCLETFQ